MLDIGLIVVVILAIVAAWFILKREPVPPPTPAGLVPPPPVTLPVHVQNELRTAAASGRADEAVRSLRKSTGLSEPDATAVIHALLTGRVFPSDASPPTPNPAAGRVPRMREAPIDAELMGMLKDLVAHDPDHRAAAILLLRQRTGMNDRDARKFINAL